MLKHRKSFTISFNWSVFLWISFFLVYGYFGALTPNLDQAKMHISHTLLVNISLLLILILLGLVTAKNYSTYKDQITIKQTDLYVCLAYFLILGSFNFSAFGFALYVDENSYATTSQIHGIKTLLLLAKRTSYFDSWMAKSLLQGISAFLLISLFALFYKLNKFGNKLRIIFLSVLLICARLFITGLGGNGSPHPPLELAPPFVLTSIFGIDDFVFKLSYFIPLILLLTCLHSLFRKKHSALTSFLLPLAIGTIPLVLHMSTVVEHSFWSFLTLTWMFAEFEYSKTFNITRLVCIASIMALARQPLFIFQIPLAIMALSHFR